MDTRCNQMLWQVSSVGLKDLAKMIIHFEFMFQIQVIFAILFVLISSICFDSRSLNIIQLYK